MDQRVRHSSRTSTSAFWQAWYAKRRGCYLGAFAKWLGEFVNCPTRSRHTGKCRVCILVLAVAGKLSNRPVLGWRLPLNLAIREQMSGRTNRQGSQKSRLRQALLVLLASVYVLVGFGGEISCAEEAIPYSTADVSAGSDKADVDGKKTPTVVDHCYTCVPLTVPVAASVYAPAFLSGIVSFRCSTILALEPRLLDTPPPKAQI